MGKTQSVRTLVSRKWQLKSECGHASGIKADVDLSELPEGANHQSGTYYWNHCQRDLSDHQSLSQSVTSATTRGSLPRAAQRSCQIAVAHLHQRGHSKNENRKNRDA